jgi:hypothetical protein
VRVGQTVRLVARNGDVHHFVVTRVRNYSKTGMPGWLFDQTGPLRLRLITCSHKVVYANGHFHYTDNLVVTARPVP